MLAHATGVVDRYFNGLLRTSAELLNKIASSKQLVVTLVGSAISWDGGGGVPGVAGILKIARDAVRSSGLSEIEFDKALATSTDAKAYQTALDWLRNNINQDCVNDVIRTAVLRARVTGAPLDPENDGELCDWYLPKAAVDLASLVVGAPKRFVGTVLTTNFDPLISISIERAGRPAVPVTLDSDGGFRMVLSGNSTAKVVHLHGYWRQSDTMHTEIQLTASRPRLQTDIQAELMGKSLLVVGYAGWDDIATRALAELCLQPRLEKTEILWCFHEADQHVVNGRYVKLIEAMSALHVKGRFFAFGGIDCHSIFASIRDRLGLNLGSADVATRAPFGWSHVRKSDLDGIKPIEQFDLVRFFDGAAPSLRHVAHTSTSIAARNAVRELTKELTARSGRPFIFRISGGGGEGKTTVLLQAINDVLRAGDWQVLMRVEVDAPISSDLVLSLDPNVRWLLFVDDADNLVQNLKVIELALAARSRGNIGFVVACRTTDWLAAGGEAGWSGYLERIRPILLVGLSLDDSKLIVDSWATAGPAGLAALASVAPTLRAAKFKNAVRDELSKSGEGALLGGLLAVRYTDQRLRVHVRSMLERLHEYPIPGSSSTLYDALLAIACVHSVGIEGIFEGVLAELVSLSPDAIRPLVLDPLAEEAAGRSYAGHVITRHRRLSLAIVEEAADTFSSDLTAAWRDLLRVTSILGRLHKAGSTHSKILHVGPKLFENLPAGWSIDRRADIATVVAEAAVQYQSEWLGCVVTLAKTLRKANRFSKACDVFKDAFDTAKDAIDYRMIIRGYLHEWAVCEGTADRGQAGSRRNAWLDLGSLADLHERVEITDEDLMQSNAGIGESLGTLIGMKPNVTLLKLRRAAISIGRLSRSLNAHTTSKFDKYDIECSSHGVERCQGINEALAWWTHGVRELANSFKDADLLYVVPPAELQFVQLEQLVRARAGR